MPPSHGMLKPSECISVDLMNCQHTYSLYLFIAFWLKPLVRRSEPSPRTCTPPLPCLSRLCPTTTPSIWSLGSSSNLHQQDVQWLCRISGECQLQSSSATTSSPTPTFASASGTGYGSVVGDISQFLLGDHGARQGLD